MFLRQKSDLTTEIIHYRSGNKQLGKSLTFYAKKWFNNVKLKEEKGYFEH